MAKTFVADVEVAERRIFLRNDFNVPLDAGRITDDTRIAAALPTFHFLLERGARVVCASHLGRPKGEVIPDCTLAPVARRLGERLGRKVEFCPETVGPKAEKAKAKLKPGQVLLLENLRFHPGETKNDPAFAAALAQGADLYVDDAFGACHRAHASIAEITRHVKLAAAGFLLKKEIDFLTLAAETPPPGYLVILGGAKVSDKLPLLKRLVEKADAMLIGGAMAKTFLKAEGMDVGASPVEDDQLDLCRDIRRRALERGVRFLLPVDHIAATHIAPNITVRIIRPGEAIPGEMMGLDIGPETVEAFRAEIARAKLIFWNGPMGVFEVDAFASGTLSVAKSVASSSGLTIVGGGDTDSALHKTGLSGKVSFISTAGGAFLEMLGGRVLPGVAVLEKK